MRRPRALHLPDLLGVLSRNPIERIFFAGGSGINHGHGRVPFVPERDALAAIAATTTSRSKKRGLQGGQALVALPRVENLVELSRSLFWRHVSPFSAQFRVAQ